MAHKRLTPDQYPLALACGRCGFRWMPRSNNRRPRICPNCSSRRWWWPAEVIKFLDESRAERARLRRATKAQRANT
jgi:hypothetical protein